MQAISAHHKNWMTPSMAESTGFITCSPFKLQVGNADASPASGLSGELCHACNRDVACLGRSGRVDAGEKKIRAFTDLCKAQ
ncbi:hypothetical protein BD310DRAFT_917607, partial [Dichomitus squalens]